MSLSTPLYLKEQNLSGDANSIDKIREEFKKFGIKVSYSPEEYNRRVIFSATKQQRQVTEYDRFVSECNGLILQSDTWKPLVIPPKTFKSNIKVDLVNAGIARNEYEILEAVEGTMINLYFFANRWRISTAKGFDVTYLKWNGRVYTQIFKEVLRACLIDVGPFYESLNKGMCYTFCFTHPDFHPFWKTRANSMKITFIQFADLATEKVFTKNPFEDIPSQKKVTGIKNIRDLFKELPKTLDNFTNHGTVNFGYIMRLKDCLYDTTTDDDERRTYSNILLESRLMQTIRHLYYNGQHNRMAREKKYDLGTYIIVSSFLDKRTNSRFIQLFPQFAKQFEELESISIKLITRMIGIIANPDEETKEQESDPLQAFTASAKILCAELNKVYTIDLKSRDSFRTISSFILTPAYIDVFYNLYIETAEEAKPCTSTLDEPPTDSTSK